MSTATIDCIEITGQSLTDRFLKISFEAYICQTPGADPEQPRNIQKQACWWIEQAWQIMLTLHQLPQASNFTIPHA